MLRYQNYVNLFVFVGVMSKYISNLFILHSFSTIIKILLVGGSMYIHSWILKKIEV